LSTQGIRLQAIADAIREKEGTTALIPAETFAERILALPVGVQAPEITLPAAGTQAERLARIAVAIRAKEGSEGPIPAERFAERILALTEQPSGRLPAGYTEVEYIFLSTDAGIYLGRNFSTSGLKLELEIDPSRSDVYLFNADGAKYGTATYYLKLYLEKWAVTHYNHYSSSGKVNTGIEVRGKSTLRVDFSAGNISVGDKSAAIGKYPVNLSYKNVHLGDCDNSVTPVLESTGFNIYSAKITQYSDEIVLVPCIEESSNEAGLYDLNANAFLKKSAGSRGIITAGPAV